VTLTHNSNQTQQELTSTIDSTLDLRFITINNQFLSTSHQILNGKLTQFLNQKRSVKQLIRVK
jgi:hypothetical protein